MRQINVKYPCVSTYEKHETWMPHDPCCSLYSLPKRNMCPGTEEISHFFVIPLFSLDPVKPFQGSRDESGIQATVCKMQATQIKKKSKPCCIFCWFCGGKQGPLCNLWVTCSMLQHVAWKAAWATREENIPERALIPEDFQEQRSQTASENDLRNISSWISVRKAFWRNDRALDTPNLGIYPPCSFSEVRANRAYGNFPSLLINLQNNQ